MKKKIGFPILAAAVLTVSLWPAASFEENVYAARRDVLRIQIDGQAVLYSGREETAYGLDKNFYYLTGLAVPNAFLLMSGDSRADKLFLDPNAAPMPGADIILTSGIVNVFHRNQIGLFLSAGLAVDLDVYFPSAYAPSDPAYLYPSTLVIEHLLAGMPPVHRNNLYGRLAALRTIKNAAEIELVARAADITGRGLLAGLGALRPGMFESDLQRVIEDAFLFLGASRTSFPSIVGSGPNSLILHYQENTRRMNAGEVVTVDIGAEYARYAGDVTRTLPVSGVFTARQREVYEVVLECQRRVFEACRPGATWADLNSVATTYAAEKGYWAYVNFSDWRHSTCHSLGLDVHDPVSASPLAPGMIITVEPGIYLPAENLGVRIEDDVLITNGPCIILTNSMPRKPDEIEAAIAGRYPGSEAGGRDENKAREERVIKRPDR
jgi:Xaa-Pro aminopeptidase